MMGVGEQLKKILQEQNITIKQLSEKTGIPVNTLYSITKRKSKRVREDIVKKIATALGVSVDMLNYGFEIDRDYELVSETLETAGFCMEATGLMDNYYIWHSDTEDAIADKKILNFSDLLKIVTNVQKDAEAYKYRYIEKRLETELF